MQLPRIYPAAGDLVRVRRQRWRVLRASRHGDLLVVTLAGAGVGNAGVVRSFLAPFDRIEAERPPAGAERAPARRWRRVVRALIASSAPAGSLRALGRAAVDLMPYQLEPALAVVRGLCTRLLLADDVGLGKTIEAGLIVAELRGRAAAPRVLVLTPSGLRDQWRAELRERFGIEAAAADARDLTARSSAYVGQPNPWSTYETVIASIDLVKRPEHLAAVLQCAWDVVVVDEAHHASADSDRYAAVQRIAGRTPYVVLVTATPHNGDPAAFASLRGIGAAAEPCVLFRRTRADVGLPAARHARLLAVTPTPTERRMHDALAVLTRAIVREHADATSDARLALAVLNKRGMSSAYALRRSASRRLESLEATSPGDRQAALPFDDPDGELDAGDDTPVWSGRPALADAARERRLLEAIEAAASRASDEGESKLRVLRRWLRRVREPVIVFSEYRDTLRHLARAIDTPSVQLHGGLAAAERRSVLESFARDVPVLLATDVAGEGLNLHERCRTVINLELPWNPVRLEQRIGRVDRIGQRRTVHALTLTARDTAEEIVLARLRSRIARAQSDAAAADPLGVVAERDVERLVIGGEPLEPAPTPGDDRAPRLSLETESASEVDRGRLVRRVGLDPPAAAIVRPMIGRVTHRSTRIGLGRRTLLLIEATVEDGRGADVERILLSAAIDEDVDPGLLVSAIGTALHRWPPIRADLEHAEAAARAFAAARLNRERAIQFAITPLSGAALVQPGLFDRRAERTAAAVRAAATAAKESLAQRLADAERAASRCDVQARIRLVLKPPR